MRFLTSASFILAVFMSFSCGSSNNMTGASGTTTVMLTDSPFSGAQAVLVTFSQVSVHPTGSDFETVPFANGAANRTCDLKKLVGAQDVLGTAALAPGHYTQIRLEVVAATLYFDGASSGSACAASIGPPSGRSADVVVPSGDIRLNREFDVTSAALTITLDFNGDASIHATGGGNYIMNPVISVVSIQ